MASSVIVVGAGVSGLTSAICLAEAGWTVRVVAAEPPERTTSMVAGAMWGPSFQRPLDKTLAWTRRSLAEFTELAGVADSGVRMAPAVTVGELAAGEVPPQARMIPELRPCEPDELPAGFTSGYRSRMPTMDMPRYLEYLRRRLVDGGGEIEIRKIGSLDEVLEDAPVVVNCAGLGARELVGDEELNPIFGQHVMMTNPGLDELFMELTLGTEWVSYFPHRDRVVCGGIRTPGRWDTTPDDALTERIIERCQRVEPRLRDAEVIEVVTGLRPDRPVVRVEAEDLPGGRCVHNYGHGGAGVGLSWGCAQEVVELVGKPGE
jgi:D-amino-acid oxidase